MTHHGSDDWETDFVSDIYSRVQKAERGRLTRAEIATILRNIADQLQREHDAKR